MFFLPAIAVIAEALATGTGAILGTVGTVGTTIATTTATIGGAVGTIATGVATTVGIETSTAATIGTIVAGSATTAINVGIADTGVKSAETGINTIKSVMK